ncbi:hypothetical protein ACQW02_19855 [Humitalea sp. 24SJ18S-53]|uniref:hypothetical protein n=1 Tax=Humitalea sp. 24SJ18S-53 TaxID=3422307 RepID=UPI003D67C0C2
MTEALTQAAILILVALIGLIAQKLVAWIDKQTDVSTREFLHGLFDLVLDAAIEKIGGLKGGKLTREEAISYAATYVVHSAPDALRRFNMDPERLREVLDLRLTTRGH